MADGVNLTKSRAQWEAALNGAIGTFRALVSESSSKAWKPVPHSASAAPNASVTASTPASNAGSLRGSPAIGTSSSSAAFKGKAREPTLRPALSHTDLAGRNQNGSAGASAADDAGAASNGTDPQPSSGPFVLKALRSDRVVVHRRSAKGADMYRAVAEVPYDGQADLIAFQSILQTPDARSIWDRLVDGGELIEQLDPSTRVCKTNYRLGWPASPRDAITISRTLADDSVLIDVSTSLPRSPDAPAYLRPAPPCVRSHVHLMAWCIQAMPAETSATGARGSASRIKITVFWSWDLKGAWLGMPSGGLGVQLPDLIKGLVRQVREGSGHVPAVLNFGSCVEVLSNSFDPSRDTRHTEYAIVIEDEAARLAEDRAEKDLDTLNRIRARRRLEAGIEYSLPATQGWDVQVSVRSQTRSSQSAAWHAVAERPAGSQRILLTIRHAKLEDPDEIVKATVRVQRVAASTGLRLNDSPFDIVESEPRTATALSARIVEDTASVSNISIGTASTGGSSSAQALGAMANASRGGTPNPAGSLGAINALVRRNYIYFTSLLQEPEAKWKPVADTKGVTVMQLDSIDLTLVVYRAEATFVGVSVWDLFSTISNPGAQAFWDKGLDDATLLSDVSDLSSLWHLKTKPAWPVSARDSVTVQTAYKSPASVHIFSFSTDDRNHFPAIPEPESGTIRTQIDLRGWSVEALSPTTVHVTMLEQSDPKGWTSKSSTPSAMINAVAGVGEYAIKFGGPPVATRLLGAQARTSKYDHDKATFRFEYEAVDLGDDAAEAPNVECEIRCDVEVWASSLDLVVDPPPISVSCLRRHRLSQGGGGLWLTIEHVAASLEDDLARITVRKGASREKGSVYVNGAQMRVDLDEIKGDEVKQLSKQKRTKPQRVPLDLEAAPRKPTSGSTRNKAQDESASSAVAGSASSEISDLDGAATRDEVLAGTTPGRVHRGGNRDDETPMPTTNTFFSDERPRQPMTCALDVLFLLRRIHAERSPDPAGNPAGWALVSERNGLYVRRKLMESISSTVVVQRGDKVVQGLSAEDLVDVVSSLGCRSQWDDKVDTTTLLECYGNGATTSFVTTKASFPFRGRAFHLASLTARAAPPAFLTASGAGPDGSSILPPSLALTPSSPSSASSHSSAAMSGPSVYFHASASFPEQTSRYPQEKVNPLGLPMGKVLIDGWILETLDPYSSTTFQIPSTRCTHVVAVDYAGSLPAAVNTLWNSNLPRSILSIEAFLKARGALPSVKTPPSCIQVLGDGRDEDQGLIWVLDDPERKHLLLSTAFDPPTRTFATVSLTKPARSSLPPLPPSPEPARIKAKTVSDASTTKAAAIRATASTATLTPSSALSGQPTSEGMSGTGGVSLSRATSMNSITSTGANASTPSTLRGRPSAIRADSRRAVDMLLMEVEVELRHFSKGYDVQIFSEFLPRPSSLQPPQPAPPSSPSLSHPKDTASTAEASSEAQGKATSEGRSRSPERPSASKETLSLSMASEPKQDLPIQIKVFDLPPSAVLAATLDPSARPRKHLVRATLPTTAFLDPIEDPLTGSKPPEVPDWYTRLQDSGAVLRMVVRPLNPLAPTDAPASSSQGVGGAASFSTPVGKVPVRCAGAKLDVVHVNLTSAMLQKEHVGAEPFAQLRRALPPSPISRALRHSKRGEEEDEDGDADNDNDNDDDGDAEDNLRDSRLPRLLQSPIAADLELRKPAQSDTPIGLSSKSGSGSRAEATATAKEGDPDKTTGAAKSGDALGASASTSASGSGRPANAERPDAKAPTAKPESSSTNSLIHILNSYPLSRLGTGSALASSLTSVSSVTAKGSSVASTSTFQTKAGSLAGGDIRRSPTPNSAGGNAGAGTGAGANAKDKSTAASATGSGSSSSASPTSAAAAAVQESVTAVAQAAARKRFSTGSVLMIALIAFLLGSLTRSFLTPVDYVLVQSSPSSSEQAGGGIRRTAAALQQQQQQQPQKVTPRLSDAAASAAASATASNAADDSSSGSGLSGEVERYLRLLGGGGSSSGAPLSTLAQDDGAPQRRWQEIRRLLELKRIWGRWTLVLALMRR
ncbi:uncharacterized protein PFL1_05348 [Pseudozyma flocculosa PF-1]|uniref:START domain-containing protein n=2 Tax=Pseudozyma flocculosa TaxID=84751 RepID=A0A5C3FCI0_9BASI|nr:uncharacterized protein PFL1_05348 [Pseudozyma flocculosa PF-1]EPQ27064.1 hypothetical protein PFL1_05348 [Pseudozyma flocculosa PF-1]SPO42143.1 uncharacterized protein PSFLO_07626 [Pseudozyma flocculosa]